MIFCRVCRCSIWYFQSMHYAVQRLWRCSIWYFLKYAGAAYDIFRVCSWKNIQVQHILFWEYAGAAYAFLGYVGAAESIQMRHMLFWEYAGAVQRVCRCSSKSMQVQQMICWGYAGVAESMQVQHRICWEYAGAAYDILRVCRCSREYAGAPDGGAAVGDKFGAAREAAGRLLLPAPRSSFSPPADFSDFNNVREQFKWKFILESRILIKKLHLIYFKSKICMGVTKDSWSWTKSWGVAFTSVHFCSQLVPSPFNFMASYIHVAHGLTQIYFSFIRSHANILNMCELVFKLSYSFNYVA